MNETPWEQIQNKLRNPDQPEDETLKNWLNEDQENKNILDDLKVIYSITGNVPESFIPRKELAWQKVLKRISIRKQHPPIVRFMLRVAASILLIALGVGGSLYLQQKPSSNSVTEVYSPYGHKTRITLPDGSMVWLNGDTKLKYHSDFSVDRNVELSGEALFEVAKNPGKLFSVNAENIRLEVYGTTFNVKSYPDDIVAEVALLEGSVGLFRDKQLLKKMIPGDVVAYNSRSNKFSTQQGNLAQITSWSADELVIENETFEEVTKYLERWYGVDITLDKSIQLNNRLSFKVKTESLTELLSIISRITPMTYEINGKQVKISNKAHSKKTQ